MRFIVIGNIGSDAGYWIIGSDGTIRHVGGWAPEALQQVAASLNIIREATNLRTPGLAQAAIKSVIGFAETQLAEHLKEGGLVVIA